MDAVCSGCGTAIPAGSKFCPSCGKDASLSAAAPGTVPQPATPGPGAAAGGLTDNVAGALCYLFIVGIIFLIIEPFNKKPFVRFHAWQAIALGVASMVLSCGLQIV